VREVAFDGNLTAARLDAAWTETYGHDAPFRLSDLERREISDTAALTTTLAQHAGNQVFAG
jgi:hypothetical protein